MRRRDLLKGAALLAPSVSLAQDTKWLTVVKRADGCITYDLIAGPCTTSTTNFSQPGTVAWVKRGFDNNNSSANTNETILTHANVGKLRQYYTLPMEGDRVGGEAQPLVCPAVVCDDGTIRDICIMQSMNNLLYAFDLNRSDIVWSKKLSVPVNGNQGTNIDAYGINDHWGMLATGVYDPSTFRIYCTAWTDPNGNAATAYWQMHVLDVRTGERVCAPVAVNGFSNSQTWNSMMRKQRSSLLMTNVNGVKTVFFASGTVYETSAGAAGWVFAFDVASNTFAADLAMTEGEGAGIWMAGGSMCADSAGYLYAVTGNGGFDGVTNFGESIVQLRYTPATSTSTATLKVIGCKTLWTDSQREGAGVSARRQVKSKKLAGINAQTADTNIPNNGRMDMSAMVAGVVYPSWPDEDFGSAPAVLLGNGWLLACGKDGIGYLVDTTNMGFTTETMVNNPTANYATLVQPPFWLTSFPGYQYNPAPANAQTLNQLYGGKTHHMHSGPVVYNGKVFVWGENSVLKVWSIGPKGLTWLADGNIYASAQIANSPGGMPGGFMCLSANGTTTGTAILWACVPDGDANKTVTTGTVYAIDAENFENGQVTVLWTSPKITYNKFCPPVVSNGHVIVNTYADEAIVYSQP